MSAWRDALVRSAHHFDFPIHRAITDLSPEQYELLWTGNPYFGGLNNFFAFVESEAHKIQYRVMLSPNIEAAHLPRLQKGTRLRPDAQYVKIGGKSIGELVTMPIGELRHFFAQLVLPDYDQSVAGRSPDRNRQPPRNNEWYRLGLFATQPLVGNLVGRRNPTDQPNTLLG